MDIAMTFLIAVGLAMDTFAVSLGVGTSGLAHSPRPFFRLTFHLGLFQGMMTFLGWLAGSTIAWLIAVLDHWIAFGLLAFVGLRMIRSGLDSNPAVQDCDPSRGRHLMAICVATSIDAMAVGLGVAMVRSSIWVLSLVIALVTLGLSSIGLLLGKRLGERFGKRMEILGGLILNAIGMRILITHLM